MLNCINANKNTGMYFQDICIKTDDKAEINYIDFETVCKDIFSAVDKFDTMNPYNTYNVYSFDMDMDSDAVENGTYSVSGEIRFNISSDMKTKYGFSVAVDDVSDLEDEIGEKLLEFFNKEVVGDIPDILIESAEFVVSAIADVVGG